VNRRLAASLPPAAAPLNSTLLKAVFLVAGSRLLFSAYVCGPHQPAHS
jgi:hypothetical protein